MMEDEEEVLEEELLDETSALFAPEEREKTVYVVDVGRAMLRRDEDDEEKMSRLEKALRYIEKEIKALIREGSKDLIGVTLYGDEGSNRAAPVIPLGKARCEGLKILKRIGEEVTGLGRLIDEMVDAERVTATTRESGLRNGLWSARAQLENSKEGGKKTTFRSVAIVTATPMAEGDTSSVVAASDARAMGIEFRVVRWGPHEYRALLEANLDPESGLKWRDFLVDAQAEFSSSSSSSKGGGEREKAEQKQQQQDEEEEDTLLSSSKRRPMLRKKLRRLGSLELTLPFAPGHNEKDELTRMRLTRHSLFRGVPKPTKKKVHRVTQKPLKAVSTKHDPISHSFLGPEDIRPYVKIGEDGRAYVTPDELKKCDELLDELPDSVKADGEVFVLGFVDRSFLDHLPFRAPASVLIADDDITPSSSQVLASLVGSLRRRNSACVAVYATKRLVSGDPKSRRRNPCLVTLEAVVSNGAPEPSGLLVAPLPFAHEIRPTPPLGGPTPRAVVPSSSADDPLADLTDALVDDLLLENPSSLLKETPSPAAAARWAALESAALGEPPSNESSIATLYRSRTSQKALAASLDRAVGTQAAVDAAALAAAAAAKVAPPKRKRADDDSSNTTTPHAGDDNNNNKQPKLNKSTVPKDYLSTNDLDRDDWIQRLLPYDKGALVTAARGYLYLSDVTSSLTKDKIIDAMADFVFAAASSSS